MEDCLFCKIIDGEINSRIVYDGEEIIAFLDINPQAPTHILIVPKKHITALSECGNEDIELLGKIQLAAKELAKKYELESYRLVANNGAGAGQTVDHLHYHLLGGRRMNWPPG